MAPLLLKLLRHFVDTFSLCIYFNRTKCTSLLFNTSYLGLSCVRLATLRLQLRTPPPAFTPAARWCRWRAPTPACPRRATRTCSRRSTWASCCGRRPWPAPPPWPSPRRGAAGPWSPRPPWRASSSTSSKTHFCGYLLSGSCVRQNSLQVGGGVWGGDDWRAEVQDDGDHGREQARHQPEGPGRRQGRSRGGSPVTCNTW